MGCLHILSAKNWGVQTPPLPLVRNHILSHSEQSSSAYYHNLMTVIPSHYSKQTPIGWFHAKKIAEAVLLFVLRIAFQTSLLCAYQELPSVLSV